jgi:hypothetical protein
MEPPPQRVDQPGAFGGLVVAGVDQVPQVSADLVEPVPGQELRVVRVDHCRVCLLVWINPDCQSLSSLLCKYG